MKEQLIDELTYGVIPFINNANVADVKMKISMILSPYEVSQSNTQLVVYEGDVNEKILKRFLISKAASGRTERTVYYYRNTLVLVLGKIGKPYNEITPDDVRLYLATRTQRDGVSKTTANNERRALSAFYGWLQKEEILLKNPMLKVEAIKEQKKKKIAFTQMDIEKIRYACKNRMQSALIEIFLSTWGRVSEVAQLKLCEIDLSKGTVLLHGKGDKDRIAYLNPKAMLAIENYLKDRKDNNPYLFPRAEYAGDVVKMCKGKARRLQDRWYEDPKLVTKNQHRDKNTIESDIRSIGKRAGVENAHPHRFRRTGATMALRAGMPLINVSKLLGHENIGTTQIYLDISDKELEQAHEKWVI